MEIQTEDFFGKPNLNEFKVAPALSLT